MEDFFLIDDILWRDVAVRHAVRDIASLLRRKYKDVFYYQAKGECDFVVLEKNTVTKAIQACLNITDENFEREYNGLKEAMLVHNLSHGQIITLNQSDKFVENGMTIELVPASYFLTH